MRGLLVAFITIWAVTAVGWLIGRYQLLGPQAETVLARLVFFVATPALLFRTLATSSLREIFTPALAAFVVSTVVLATAAVAIARLLWRLPTSESVVAGLCASYVNAANLGIPVAAYALGDVSFVAPVLLFQVLIAAPAALAVLETDGGRTRARSADSLPAGRFRGGGRVVNSGESGGAVGLEVVEDAGGDDRPALVRLALLPARNPIMLASAAGLILAVIGWRPPDEVLRPFELVGSAAVPTALLALGVSLSAGRAVAQTSAPGPETSSGSTAIEDTVAGTEATVPRRTAIVTLVALKVLVQPLVAYLFGRYGLGLAGRSLLAAVVTSGLPTAQNVFVFATRYQRGTALARDSVVVSTLLAALSLSVFAYWLG